MSDLLVALGLVLVIEGLIWAALPHIGKSVLETVAATPPSTLRIAGTVAIAIGVGIVWLVRG